jgi:hypothetical protein
VLIGEDDSRRLIRVAERVLAVLDADIAGVPGPEADAIRQLVARARVYLSAGSGRSNHDAMQGS